MLFPLNEAEHSVPTDEDARFYEPASDLQNLAHFNDTDLATCWLSP
ncbi:hypothetical protein V462_07075 [Pantoea ananatis 15320]|jgi:hypothetical protein|nr:hypothetical protein L585_13285 [Pantoea ananatis BRT175]PKC38298.1 hypothetical protein V462_07075 [Pantoea ananatis 15320]